MSIIPAELKYTKSHEWIKEEDGVFTIGLTDYAQSALGDIVFINLPEEGDEVTAGESFSDVESVKAVSDVFSPVTGAVCAVNEALLDDPAQVNESPYEAWLIKVENVSDTEELLDAEAYEAVVAAEEA
ncbi:MAG: glycine cleavage system protein GcvH [Evtepia sp.]|uniref:glycine cleavage system protein GcvH n=1 Tax=Evtepia sp. TaxID=2773933 RepID=UPI0029856D71|nr:glycine cleavage system protein GcvH [Evtepia sp.]MDD7289414.1 glycine cleavage system protein GcvH [Clostridiales bacterium]MDY3993308.1 glycine cleavage system protein GcvH [Evtepia sp.]MDY4429596.1 glycine cleavage system protein GcvH [Evtepia sp.]